MDPLNARELTHLDDPTGALEKAIELNKVKTGEAPIKTIKIDENSLDPTSPDSDQSKPKDVVYHRTFGGKNLISIADCKGRLASDMSERRKWMTLVIAWLVQISMNFNTSLYSNAIPGLAEEFDRSQTATRWGATVFLIAYAFGCELWAPWSEELGRYWVLQASLFLVNLFQFGVIYAKNLETVIACRTLGGLSTAGGSITLGIIADMWDKEHHQIPVAFIVFASVGGSVLGPIFGGLIEDNTSWQWAIWLQLIFGGFVQLLHFVFVPETRATILMDRIAKSKRAEAAREEGKKDLNRWGPNEVTPFARRFSWTEIFATWLRPFKMFITEPIVLTLSMLSGFSDALIFMFVQCFGLVYRQWGFTPTTIGLSFLPFLFGYFIAWMSFIPAIRRNKRQRAANPGSERAQFESRLWLLLYLAPCLPIGLFGFAWTSGGPPIHWGLSMIFTTLCGIANYSIYMATIDYMVTAYGPYSASATGGNGWARDFLAGVLTPAALPYYSLPLGPKHIEIASTILGAIATILVACVSVIYKYGPWLRHKSNFARKLEAANRHPETTGTVGVDYIPGGYGTAPASALHSAEDLPTAVSGSNLVFQHPLNRTGSHSTPDFFRSRVGFSRNVSPNISRGCSRNHSPSGDAAAAAATSAGGSRKTRPAHASRSQSLYHDKEHAENTITVKHPALRRTAPQTHTEADRTTTTAAAAAAAAPALSTEDAHHHPNPSNGVINHPPTNSPTPPPPPPAAAPTNTSTVDFVLADTHPAHRSALSSATATAAAGQTSGNPLPDTATSPAFFLTPRHDYQSLAGVAATGNGVESMQGGSSGGVSEGAGAGVEREEEGRGEVGYAWEG